MGGTWSVNLARLQNPTATSDENVQNLKTGLGLHDVVSFHFPQDNRTCLISSAIGLHSRASHGQLGPKT